MTEHSSPPGNNQLPPSKQIKKTDNLAPLHFETLAMGDSEKPGFWAVLMSTFAAAFGVQSQRNQERDFKHGSIWVFIAAGLIFTIVFVVTVYTIVQGVLSTQ